MGLWTFGHPVTAAARMRAALDQARSDAHPYTLAWACTYGAAFYACRRDVDAVRELTDAAVPQATDHGFELLLNLGAVHRGWVLAESGAPEHGAAQIRDGVTAYRTNGAALGLPTFLGFLAGAYRKCARAEDGLAVIEDALAVSEATGAHYWDAELRRLQGTLILGTGAAPRRVAGRRRSASTERDAESCFVSAIEIARRQQAKSLALRAATSLSRLWQRQGKTSEAHALLSEAYGWFVEGFEAADLTEARALLEQLDGATRGR